ncbi:sporulation protein [Paenibacillus sp. N1-5-1-14]|uniref:sporulation protein n=1 Tax=Paenibacillus radicibacter TaxID=2972488 RepID=UPI0021593235|nr:sporulation protein [Paenibacillus radicibacter]MCR8641795.1 sporulation protein [Paenibacillus radicibacter]
MSIWNEKIVTPRRGTLLLSLASAACVAVIIAFPDQAFQASLNGLQVWWKYVFPALLPYFILTELLVGMGLIHGIGTLLDPLLRWTLRLPGVSGWAIAVGAISGFPTGAKATAKLRSENLIGQHEGERLLAISHLASPALVLTVIGVSFFASPAIGGLLLTVHYLTAIMAAIVHFREGRKKEKPCGVGQLNVGVEGKSHEAISERNGNEERLVVAKENQQSERLNAHSRRSSPLAAMKAAHVRDGRSFGKLLGDSVTSSVGNLMVIGGYILMFSVLLHALTMTGVAAGLTSLLGVVMPHDVAASASAAVRALLSGFLEPHLGAYAWSQSGLPLMWQVAGAASVLGWGGLSAHAQVRALTQETDLRYGPFLRFRLLHSVLAAGLTVALWRPWLALGGGSQPSFFDAAAGSSAAHEQATAYGMWPMMQQMAVTLALTLAVICCISWVLRAAMRLAKRS